MNELYESEEITAKYIVHRPAYNSDFVDVVMRYVRRQQVIPDSSSTLDLMMDVGCGSGQATNMFASYFNKIIGVDASENQIKHAKAQNKFVHVEYKVGKAEELPATDKSVDLIVCAEAVHWFDLTKFFRESSRILKPTGCLVILGYWFGAIQPLQKVADVDLSRRTAHVCKNLLISKTEGDPVLERAVGSVEERYESIYNEIPFVNKERYDDLTLKVQYSLSSFCGLIMSFQSGQKFMKKQQKLLEKKMLTPEEFEEQKMTNVFCRELQKIWNLEKSEAPDLHVDYDVFLLLSTLKNIPTL